MLKNLKTQMNKRYIFYLDEAYLSFIEHVNFGKFDIQRVIELYKKINGTSPNPSIK